MFSANRKSSPIPDSANNDKKWDIDFGDGLSGADSSATNSIPSTSTNVNPLPSAMALESDQSISKPNPEEWIKGRKTEDKLNLISWLIDGCLIDGPNGNDCMKPLKDEPVPEFQTFDGFFNNLFKIDLGAVGESSLFRPLVIICLNFKKFGFGKLFNSENI